MEDIRKVHEEFYKRLIDYHNTERNFTFSFRKSNRGGKLEQGFWFYGTEKYLAVSFWSGMDWKNKTPNINFIVLNNGRSFLEIAVSDSEKKRDFIELFFLETSTPSLGIAPSGKRYIKEYFEFGNDYLRSLDAFLFGDKITIDNIIKNNQSFFNDTNEDRIGFIDNNEFEVERRKVDQYKESYNEYTDNIFQQSLKGFQIKNYGPIIDTGFIPINENFQWIFLVGENGTGKTSILRAIASGLCHTKIDSTEDTLIKFNLHNEDGNFIYERFRNEDIKKRKPLVSGFCSYGAARLKTSNEYRSRFSFVKALNKDGLTRSLFNIDTILIDIQEQLNYWGRNRQLVDIVTKRKLYIKELMIDLLPKVYNIKYSETDDWENTLYYEKDDNDNPLPPVTFDKLASGLKSLIAMIGDMMMRLFNQQPRINDPSELTGIVLIDEIDIHLHPNLQKYLVEQLTKTFPKVQFIASTHSPIPLLGAPINTHFFKVERNSDSGVEIVDLSEIGVSHLLPNAILTSDLFGMSKLFSREYKHDKIRTEDSIDEIKFNDSIKAELKEIAERLRDGR